MSEQAYGFDSLKVLLKYLRDAEFGCPWDLAQTMHTIVPHTIEEVYEVIEALESGQWSALKEELGDLLLQILFYAQMADEAGHFDLTDVVQELVAKMVRRHPHVFPNGRLEQPTAQTRAQAGEPQTETIIAKWEAIKQQELQQKGDTYSSQETERPLAQAFSRVPKELCAMSRAEKLQSRAAKFGLDWKQWDAVRTCLSEEITELDTELSAQEPDKARLADELGDVMFTCISLARHLDLDASQCLRSAIRKFTARAEKVEQLWLDTQHSSTLSMQEADDKDLHELWLKAKKLVGNSQDYCFTLNCEKVEE